jgi:hypothetical protein
MKIREDKRMIKLELIFFKTALFRHALKKNLHIRFLVHGIPLNPHSGAVYTMDHEVVPRKRPICVGRLHEMTSMVRVTKILVSMVHGPFTRCKPNVDHEE